MLRSLRCGGGYVGTVQSVSAYGRRPLFLFFFSMKCWWWCPWTSGLVIVSYPVTCFARRSEVRCRGLLKMGRFVFIVAVGPDCHSLRFTMMEVSVTLSRPYLFTNVSDFLFMLYQDVIWLTYYTICIEVNVHLCFRILHFSISFVTSLWSLFAKMQRMKISFVSLNLLLAIMHK